jgi:hypothetical protein
VGLSLAGVLIWRLLPNSEVSIPSDSGQELARIQRLQQALDWNNLHTEECPSAQLSQRDVDVLAFGDIILRQGCGRISTFIVNFLDAPYPVSHCGVWLGKEKGVLHSISNAQHDGILLEPIEAYMAESKENSLVVVRPVLSSSEQVKYRDDLNDIRRKECPFDSYFDDRDSNKIFCAELVRDALKYAGKGACFELRKKDLNQDVLALQNFFTPQCFSLILNQFDSVKIGTTADFFVN